MSVSFRPIRAEDFGAILQINAESSPHVARLDERDLLQQVALASVAWVAVCDGRVIGYLVAMSNAVEYDAEVFQSFRAKMPGPFMYIDQVAVARLARSAGIASQMYAHLEAESGRLGITALCCEVNLQPENPASMRFHLKLGFERAGDMQTADGPLVALMRKTIV